MLFNSIEYLFFLPIVFLLYWGMQYVLEGRVLKFLKLPTWLTSPRTRLTSQNALIVIASYIFYGWWDWRFLLLIAFTTLCSYLSGLALYKWGGVELSNNQRVTYVSKLILWVNILLNLGILALFKYYDFFAVEFAQLFGFQSDKLLLHLILPVGISFYTFQALSYSIDVYKGKIEPTKDIVAFFAYVSFFPQLVAGPIERATHLLPQFQQRRVFNYSQAVDGMRQILWGLFKKVVIADNCALYVDQVWADYTSYSGSTLLLAAVLFSIQIYGDFSGYSDIAIGTAKLFGIHLMQNFKTPYFSRDIAEFWRRWHISLTTWFRDYVYIPLGGSRPEIPSNIKHKGAYKKWVIVCNTFIIFLLSGFWHGANWTFILWGAYHALLFLPLILMGKNRKYLNAPTWKEIPQMLFTFALVVLGLVIFRAENIADVYQYITHISNTSLFTIPYLMNRRWYVPTIIATILMFLLEWFNRNREHGFAFVAINKWISLSLIYILVLAIVFFAGPDTSFIYFQF